MLKKIDWLVIFTFLLLAIFFFRINNQLLQDTYWHMAVGKEVLETKKIPTHDNFVYGSKSTNYTSTEWLSGLIFFETYEKFHIFGLSLLKMLAGLGTIFFLYKTLAIFTKDKFKINFFLLLVSYLISHRLFLRPEMFSFLFLAITNYICFSYYYKNRLPHLAFLLPLIFLIWPNIHGFAPAGIVILAFFASTITIEHKIFRKERVNYTKFILFFVLSCLTVVPQIDRLLFFTNTSHFSSFIPEWNSLKGELFTNGQLQNELSTHWTIYLYILILIIYLFAFYKSKKSILSLFYFVVLLAPIKFYRLISPTVIIATPILVHLLEGKFNTNISLRLYQIFFSTTSLLILISALSAQIIGKPEQIWPPTQPIGSERFIKENLHTKRLFTLGIWNDYYIFNIQSIKTFSDVMNEYRDRESLLDESSLVNPNNDPQALLSKYNIDTVVNTQNVYRWSSSTNLGNLQNWRLVYISELTIIYARKDIIKNNHLDLSLINPYLNSDLKFQIKDREEAIKEIENLLNYDPQNGFARSQLILNYIDENQWDEAKKLALESRVQIPGNSYYSFLLAIIYGNLNDCEKASMYATEALNKTPD